MKRLYEPPVYDSLAQIGSWWQDSATSAPPCPTLTTDIDTEIAIIGAGFTGLNAALQLAEKHSAACVVLEAAQPGWGASGRNGGFACLGGAKMSATTQIRKFGLAQARLNAATEAAAVDQVRANLSQYEIDADTHSDGELCLAHRPDIYPQLVAEAGFNRDNFGLQFDLIPRDAQQDHGVTGPEFFGGVITRAGFALNPLKYVLGLARAAAAAGVQVYGDSPVTETRKRADGRFELITPQGIVRTQKLIIATNGYSSDDIPAQLGGRFLPVLSSIIVTRPLTPQEQAEQGWTSALMSYDSRNLLHYFRLMPDGRFLIGQRGAVRSTFKATQASQHRARADFERMFPAWAHVETPWSWSGLVCLTRNLHQFIGPLQGLEGAFTALGYHGNGVAMGSFAGRAVADIAAGQHPVLPTMVGQPLKRFPLPGLRRNYLRGAFLKYRISDRFF